MRVLYLCHRIPYPPNKGDKIRAFQHIRALTRHHEVDLFTLADEEQDLGNRPALLKFCRRVTVELINPTTARLRALPYLLSQTPLSIPCFRSRALARHVRKALAEQAYDRIFVYCSPMMQYVPYDTNIPVVLDLVDIDSDKWAQYARASRFPMSLLYRREAECLKAYERSACARVRRALVTTEREAALARESLNVHNMAVLPNGLDAEYFRPCLDRQLTEAPTAVFIGDMSYFPNQQAVEFFAMKVFPLVRASIASARFLIVGRRPNRAVLRLAEIPGVEVTGSVPDVRPWLAAAHVLVAPLLIAAGVPNKILEGMAAGLPVVASTRATQGLSDRVREVIDIADGPAGLALKTTAFLRDVPLALRKGAEARERVTEEHDWERSAAALLRLVEEPENWTRVRAERHASHA